MKKTILFIGGNEDVSAPKHLVIKQAIFPQLAMIEIFENCGHQSMIEKKNELIEKILQFITFPFVSFSLTAAPLFTYPVI